MRVLKTRWVPPEEKISKIDIWPLHGPAYVYAQKGVGGREEEERKRHTERDAVRLFSAET